MGDAVGNKYIHKCNENNINMVSITVFDFKISEYSLFFLRMF